MFDSYELCAPASKIVDLFEAVTAPSFALVHSLALENIQLEKIRDMLLPKLVTGQIDVSNLDVDALLEGVA